jgi:hypothetical protein
VSRLTRWLWVGTGITVLAMTFLLTYPRPPSPSTLRGMRAVWVWNASTLGHNMGPLVRLCLSQVVNTVFLAYGPDDSAASYSALVRTVTRARCEVWAAGGSPDWATPRGREALRAWLAAVQTYNRSVPVVSRFTGIALDIEPWSSRFWPRDSRRLVKGYETSLLLARSVARHSSLLLAVTVPFWWGDVPTSFGYESVGVWTVRHANMVIVLAYRPHIRGRGGVAQVAGSLIGEAARAHRQAVVGVTTRRGPLAVGNSFSLVQIALRQLQVTLASKRGFGGWAVNNYKTWIQLPGAPR